MPSLNLERDLIEQIPAPDPGAATPLYDRFGSSIRALILHHLPGTDPTDGVFHALITVARAIRQGEVRDDDHLVSQVWAAANAYIEHVAGRHMGDSQWRGARASEPHSTVNELLEEFSRLDSPEQEILTRFYRLEQTERQISREMKIPIARVRAVRRKIRKRYLTQGQG